MHKFFRGPCLLCGTTGDGELCLPCLASLPRITSPRCAVCALPVANSRVCGACLANTPAFDHTVAALRYAFPVDALVHALKYQANFPVVHVLANLLIEVIEGSALPDFIVPMPLHPRRLSERGFNQALEIARKVAKKYHIALLPAVCERIRDTPAQTGLPWKEREKNIRSAFRCKAELAGKHIAVLDDVMTTGATLNDLAKTLCRHGASRVSNWVVARTLPSPAGPYFHENGISAVSAKLSANRDAAC